MAQTVNGKSVSFIRSVAEGTDAASIAVAELDQATRIDAEITAVGLNPTEIDSSVSRSPHGQYEILTVLIWV